MNQFLVKGSLALGSLLVFALPALPDTINFNFSNSCPTTSTCSTGVGLTNIGGTNYMTGFVGTLSTLVATGGTGTGGASDILTATGTTLTLTSSGAGNGSQDSFVLSGTLSCSSCNTGGTAFSVSSSNLLTIIENYSTATGSGAGSVVTYAAVTGLTGVNSALGALLGLTTTDTAALSGSGNQLTAAGSGTTSYSAAPLAVSSETFDITATPTATATPEPASFVLFGAGLVCAGLVSRRRIANKS